MSNLIDHIEITNFKSIRHQKIEGCKRINVFIGYPNVGKSNILEAMSTLSYLQKEYYQPLPDLCRLRNPSELFFDANIKEEITVKYSKKPYSNVSQIAIRYLSESKIDFAIRRPNLDIIGGKGEWEFMKNMFFIPDPQKEYSNLSAVDFISQKMQSDEIKVRKYQFHSSYDHPNLYSNHKTNGLGLFAPLGENLVDIVQFNKPLRKEVAEMFKANGLKLSIDQSTNSIKALKELDDETIFLIPFYQMADTLQRLIFHKAAIMSNENAVLLFEEPEAHMFPPYIRKFTGDIIFNKENKNQYFISTHSPIVIEDFLADAYEDLSVYLVGLKDGETIIKRLSDEELKEVNDFGVDLFFNIESYLD